MNTDKAATIPLSQFHPIITHWFRDRYQCPTDIQSEAWGYIQEGHHILVIAPTGSGKTLMAILWALNELVTAKLPPGQTRVLYVSPLKALNYDIQRNLLQPLEELKIGYNQANQEMPEIRVLTRTGDTPFTERRQMLRRPPEILITTAESLNLLPASPQARTILSTIRTLILDEIHSVFDTKQYDVKVRYPLKTTSHPRGESIWDALVGTFKAKIEQNPSTLLFVNNRRLCEKIVLKLNLNESDPLAYAH